MKLTDEEVVIKFFKNIEIKPQNKDSYIRDFEEFYFKNRPKFGPKLIKLLLEVRILFLINSRATNLLKCADLCH